MHIATLRFSTAAAELERLSIRREDIINTAFDTLIECAPALTSVLLESLGGRRRALHWLSMPQRAFDGRTAWALLGEGDMETVWDSACRLGALAEAWPGGRRLDAA